VQERQHRSFDALYADYGDQLYRLCYRLCGNAADAEDLTQEVFIEALRDLPGFQGRAKVQTWLYRVAVHRLQRLRRRDRVETISLAQVAEDPEVCADQTAAELERLTLEGAFASLSEPLPEAFVLVKAEGLKYHEAAEVLGAPVGTVKSRVHEAMVRLRGLLEEPPCPPVMERGAPHRWERVLHEV